MERRSQHLYEFGPYQLNTAERLLLRDGTPVPLTPKAFEVLCMLVERQGKLVEKEELIRSIWSDAFVEESNLTNNVYALRKALGDGGSGKGYIETVPKRGYRFTATVRELPSEVLVVERHSVTRVVTEEEGQTVAQDYTEQGPPAIEAGEELRALPAHEEKALTRASAATDVLALRPGRSARRRPWLLFALVGLALAASLFFAYRYLWKRSAAGDAGGRIESIAVLPFKNESGNPDVEYLSDGMTESLINSLARLPRLSVKSRGSVFPYKGKEVEPKQAASELSVQAILMGRLVQRGDDLMLYLSLVDGSNGNQLWGEQYQRKMTELASLQTEIAREVSDKLRLRLTNAEQQQMTKGGTNNTEAYQAYLKGRYYWNRAVTADIRKSLAYFQQAVELDPNYALPHVGLADYYGYSASTGLLPPEENWPRAEAEANQALALDDTMGEAYNALAAFQLYNRRDWPAAERYFRKGLELKPSYAELHNHYARCLIIFGRNEEALAEIRRAVELDPLSLRYNLSWCILLYQIRQYDAALEQARKTLEIDPNYPPVHEWLGYLYEKKGMQREAIAEWAQFLTLIGGKEEASALEQTYAASGFEAAVRGMEQHRLKDLDERVKRGEYVAAGAYASAYARMGDREQAFAWLGKVVDERNRFALELRGSPVFDSLRDDPRFADLLRRVSVST